MTAKTNRIFLSLIFGILFFHGCVKVLKSSYELEEIEKEKEMEKEKEKGKGKKEEGKEKERKGDFNYRSSAVEKIRVEDEQGLELEKIYPEVASGEIEEEEIMERIRIEVPPKKYKVKKDVDTILLEQELEVEFDIPIKLNEEVSYFIDFFTKTEYRKVFSKWLSRSTKYIPIMREILEREGLPGDLVYLAMVESGFSTRAVSRAKAVGPWQFIEETARRYGLKIDFWVDERRDPIRSTLAASRYIIDLLDMFNGSWYLALAGYNAGERRIEDAMNKTNSDSFWEISANEAIPKETRNYIPKFLAATIISKTPKKFNFVDIQFEEPLEFDEVELEKQTDINVIARAAGCTIWDIIELNPHLRRVLTPPYPYTVRVPVGKGQKVAEYLAVNNPYVKVSYVRYKVKRGDTVSKIARKFGLRDSDIRALNGGGKVKVGSVLKIPSYNIPSVYSDARQPEPQYKLTRNQWVSYYRVRRGDSLSTIASKFGISVKDLKRANGGMRTSRLLAGQKIIIPINKKTTYFQNVSYTGKALAYRYHIVSRGENVIGIAKRYNVSVDDIVRANKLKRKKSGERIIVPIQSGQKLKIPLKSHSNLVH